jgi:hypothetical protein
MGGTCLWCWSLGLKLGRSGVAIAPGYPPATFLAFGMYVMYISIFLYMLMYKDIKNSCHYVPAFLHPPSELGFLGSG